MNTTSIRDKQFLFVALAFLAALPLPAAAQPTQFEITILSSRTYAVSGGDTLAQVRVPASTPLSDVLVRLNGQDVTSAFRAVDAVTLQGLVTGLGVGANALAAGPRSTGQILAKILIVNHPIIGPIFSGPHQTPFICQTQNFALPITGGTAGPALDADCSIATRVDYVYRSSSGTYKPLVNPLLRPSDLVQTTTNEGRLVNYIVRVETGTINRAIYQIAILHDPVTDAAITPWTHPAGWNSRLVYDFGGGCAPGYRQGTSTGGVLTDLWLSQGFAAAASSLNVFGTNCDDVISAETATMVKEHFIEQYGVPRYTIGWGTSGGSMQQHLLTHNYPGILDGITPGRSFPDALTFFTPITDCPLLARAIGTSTLPWTLDQKIAVGGWGNWDFCIGTGSSDWAVLSLALIRPTAQVSACNATIPPPLLYDPATNPGGARCTFFDNAVNVFGRNAATGFALRAIDNVGIQYGLQALNSGQIGVEQFLDINARVGGYDVDGNFISGRTVADDGGLQKAYQTGRLDSAAGGLPSVPIIDYRAYRDFVSDPHDSVRSRIMRARLIAANGDAANQVILVSPYDGTTTGAAIFAFLQSEVLRLMDQWLANISGDAALFANLHQKVVRDKPSELVDACYDAAGNKVTDLGTCQGLYPPHGNPRIAAGEPLRNDVLKCQLKPVAAGDYTVSFNTSQFTRLQAIFPNGVCDYSKPGIEQQPAAGIWLAYPTPGTFFHLQ